MATENLIELFGNRTFRIPDYQRGYAWSERQLNELWDDIEDITERQGEYAKHYTGTIFIEEMQSSAIKESERWFKSTKFSIQQIQYILYQRVAFALNEKSSIWLFFKELIISPNTAPKILCKNS